ncbi:TRAP transporter small permease [Cobetia amphilecti]|uniref:TRAP transporter small permease n=1 Tax=Cobetia amphilecti TaxID=1055104 RepID=UPI0024497EFD|nr:TRAP transporter small permease [Cobetia litoralis]MDH2422853.1 TRAP transporter small permease [Cobetia litoralis]
MNSPPSKSPSADETRPALAETNGAQDPLAHLPAPLRRLAAWFERGDQGLAHVERWLIALCVLGMATASIANVIGRNVFNYSLPFTEELMQILQLWLTFLGISYGARAGRHIRVTALLDFMPPWLRKVLLIAGQVITCALLAYLAWLAVDYLQSLAKSGRVTPSLRWSLAALYAVVPLGLALGALQYLMAILRNLLAQGAWLSWRTAEMDENEEVDGSGAL